jgi:hypothetical protein
MLDNVFTTGFAQDTDELHHVIKQPTEDLILHRNSELRKNKGVLLDLGKGEEGGTWGRHLATIPFVMIEQAIRKGFDLNSKDADIAAAEMRRFLQTPEGQLCLVQ